MNIKQKVITNATIEYLNYINSFLNTTISSSLFKLLDILSDEEKIKSLTDEQKAFINTIKDLYEITQDANLVKVMLASYIISMKADGFVNISINERGNDNTLLNFVGKITFPIIDIDTDETSSKSEEFKKAIKNIYIAIFKELITEDVYIRSTESLTAFGSINTLTVKVSDKLETIVGLFGSDPVNEGD